MNAVEIAKKKALWWIFGSSLGAAGSGILLLGLLLVVVLLGMFVSSSDSSMDGIPMPDNERFDIPAPLLPIYLQAEKERATWALLAAIHSITNGFGAENAKRKDAIGGLGFPRLLWETYKVDGDGDGKLDPDNPVDAIFSLARYLQSGTETDAFLSAWFLDPGDVARVHEKEMAYAAMLNIPRGWFWPVIGYTVISSPYGNRNDPVSGEPGVFHDGIDIPVPRGTPVFAIQAGTVIQTSSGSSGYGQLIRLQHAGGFQSFYGHLSVIGVRIGQQVSRGEMIGLSGSTGKSTGPHLHLGMAKDCQSVNPALFLTG